MSRHHEPSVFPKTLGQSGSVGSYGKKQTSSSVKKNTGRFALGSWTQGDTHHVSRHHKPGVFSQNLPDAEVARGVEPVLHPTKEFSVVAGCNTLHFLQI